MSGGQDPLAYGRYYEQGQQAEGERGLGDSARGFLTDGLKKLKDQYGSSHSGQQGYSSSYGGQGQSQSHAGTTANAGQPQSYQSGSYNQQQQQQQQPYQSSYTQNPNRPQGQGHGLSSFLGRFEDTISGVGNQLAQKIGTTIDADAYAGYGSNNNANNRFGSFAPARDNNDVKWHVDGFTYFWAVSRALENARESIWILDWWVSPELYLRRPPAKNEQYRLDRMLQAAAQRGVQVNIVVYKEVEKALSLNSKHTQTALEALHPNIAVFRHPDHIPDGADIKNDLTASFQKMSLAGISQLPGDVMKALYGTKGDTVLYWAHHEKLCLIDGKIAFMGGLDLCFGRWDTNQHAIADVHPGDLSQIVFPGQDYNDARVLDFQNVSQYNDNQVDRKVTSRMGWSDISISLRGPVVEDLRKHFVDRWNYIYDSKYRDRNQPRYQRLDLYRRGGYNQPQGNVNPQGQQPQQVQPQQGQQQPGPPNQGQLGQEPHWQQPQTQSPQPSGQYYQAPGSQGQQLPPPPAGAPPAQQQSQWQGQQQTQTQSYYPPAPEAHAQQQQYSAQPYSTPPPASQGQQPPLSGTPQQQYTAQQYSTPAPGQEQQPPTPSGTPQQQLQWQGQPQQQTQAQSYYPPAPESHTQQQPPAQYHAPPPAGNAQELPTQWQGEQHGQQQYQHQQSYDQSTGQYYPPPPAGAPPSQAAQTAPYASHLGYDSSYGSHTSTPAPAAPAQAPYFPPPPGQEQQTQTQTRGFEDGSRGFGGGQSGSGYGGDVRSSAQNLLGDVRGFGQSLRGQLAGQVYQYQDRYITNFGRTYGNEWCQVVRSVSPWSGGIPLEHSVQNAYIAAIRNSQHFIYIENQFFITATGDNQKPVQNKIGQALVERILQAAKAGQKFKVIVVIPSVPGFAGDLRDDSALGTRAIMEYQYNSINRGGNSIMELIAKEGYNPMEYIRFYNLRNYDRINTNSTMIQAERASGVNYDAARKYHDAAEVGYGGYAGAPPAPPAPAGGFDTTKAYDQYQQAANAHPSATSGRWDSVSECYMLGGADIRNVPWDSDLPEIDAFVSEELYVHSKVLIADDRIVICGSANLNDRSQLGSHDSEIALVIEDPTTIDTTMNGQPWQASRFAASLRRELTRKHLGLLKVQDYTQPNANCEPVGVAPNDCDLTSPESQVVADPLSDTFQSLWNSRARTNTEVYRKVFNVVPDDYVRNWDAYKEFFEYNFRKADIEAEGKRVIRPPKYEWGHVVRDNFAPGPEGAQQVKEQLSQVKGTLVEMPLMFLIEEDIAKEGLAFNGLTAEIYT